MARLDGVRSEALFDTLADWNDILKHASPPSWEPEP